MQAALSAILVILLHNPSDCSSLLYAQTTRQHDPSDSLQSLYVAVSGNFSTNTRNVSIGVQDDQPTTIFGISFASIGHKFFHSRRLRTFIHLEKIMNGYPASSFIRNYRMQAAVGCNVITEASYHLYPFAGIYGLQSQAINDSTDVSSIPFQLGIGGEYFIKQTPLVIGLQCSYQYTLPIFSLTNNDQFTTDKIASPGLSGFNAKLYIGVHLVTE